MADRSIAYDEVVFNQIMNIMKNFGGKSNGI